MNKKIIVLLCITFFTLTNCAVTDSGYRKKSETLIVYYFHRTLRCSSCLLLEELTRDTLTTGFDAQVKKGKIQLSVINIEETGNTHFEEHYNLTNQSVVLSMVVDGRELKWKNLTEVWDHLHEREQLMDYIENEIRIFI